MDTVTLLLVILLAVCIVAIPFVLRKRSISGLDLPQQRERPFTKHHGIVAPKFGSAGSGGAEYEPGPARDREGGAT
jgi:hypothetical protein